MTHTPLAISLSWAPLGIRLGYSSETHVLPSSTPCVCPHNLYASRKQTRTCPNHDGVVLPLQGDSSPGMRCSAAPEAEGSARPAQPSTVPGCHLYGGLRISLSTFHAVPGGVEGGRDGGWAPSLFRGGSTARTAQPASNRGGSGHDSSRRSSGGTSPVPTLSHLPED